jgi:hypothetical protein
MITNSSNNFSFSIHYDGFPLDAKFLWTARDASRKGKLLKNWIENYSHHQHDNGNVKLIEPPWLSICSMQTYRTKYRLLVLLTGLKLMAHI